MIATLLSLSRAEAINLIIVMTGVTMLACYRRRLFDRRVVLTGLVIVFMAMTSAVVLRESVIGRFVLPDDDSAASRVPMAKVALRMILGNPVFGVGLHNYTQVMRTYGLERELPGQVFGVHNAFLFLAAEIGIVGLALLVSLWVVAYRRLFWAFRRKDELVWHTAAAVILGLAALFMHSLVEQGFHVDQVLAGMLWFYFGLAAALTAMELQRERPHGHSAGG